MPILILAPGLILRGLISVRRKSMRRYETIFIADPDLQDEARTTLFDKYKKLIAQQKGILADFDDWGNRKLAYEIRKKPRGHYVCVTYGGNGALVAELERNFRLDDKILKFMTILLEKELDPASFAPETEPETVEEEAAEEEKTGDVEAAAEKDDTPETEPEEKVRETTIKEGE